MEKLEKTKIYDAVTVGERGQVVIPAKIRKLFQIEGGDKLVIFAKPDGPIGLIPAEQFSQFLEEATAMLAKIKQKKK